MDLTVACSSSMISLTIQCRSLTHSVMLCALSLSLSHSRVTNCSPMATSHRFLRFSNSNFPTEGIVSSLTASKIRTNSHYMTHLKHVSLVSSDRIKLYSLFTPLDASLENNTTRLCIATMEISIFQQVAQMS